MNRENITYKPPQANQVGNGKKNAGMLGFQNKKPMAIATGIDQAKKTAGLNVEPVDSARLSFMPSRDPRK